MRVVSSRVSPFFFSLSLSLPTKESADVFFEIFSLSLSLSVFALLLTFRFKFPATDDDDDDDDDYNDVNKNINKQSTKVCANSPLSLAWNFPRKWPRTSPSCAD